MRILFLLYFFFLVGPLFAQKNTGSSFIVDSLNKEAFDAKRSDISKALNLLIIAQNTAKQIDYKKGQAVALFAAAAEQPPGKTAGANTFSVCIPLK